jgi:hypothetical protein
MTVAVVPIGISNSVGMGLPPKPGYIDEIMMEAIRHFGVGPKRHPVAKTE